MKLEIREAIVSSGCEVEAFEVESEGPGPREKCRPVEVTRSGEEIYSIELKLEVELEKELVEDCLTTEEVTLDATTRLTDWLTDSDTILESSSASKLELFLIM